MVISTGSCSLSTAAFSRGVLFRFVGNLKNWSMVEKFFHNESGRFFDNFFFGRNFVAFEGSFHVKEYSVRRKNCKLVSSTES